MGRHTLLIILLAVSVLAAAAAVAREKRPVRAAEGCDRYVQGNRDDGERMADGRMPFVRTGQGMTKPAAEDDAQIAATTAANSYVFQNICRDEPDSVRCRAALSRITHTAHIERATALAMGGRFEACVVATIPTSVTNPAWAAPNAVPEAMSDVGERLEATLRQTGWGDSVTLGGFYWLGTGCSASDVGSALKGLLLNGLAGLHVAGSGDGRYPTLNVLLSARPGELTLTLELVPRNREAPAIIEGFSLPPDLFDLPVGEAGNCNPDSIRQASEHAGPGAPSWDLPGEDALLCDGERYTPILYLPRPMKIQVFAVEQSGSAVRLFPDPEVVGWSGGREGRVALDTFRANWDPDDTDPVLLAVAVPAEAATPGPMARFEGQCLIGSLDDTLYPANAVLKAVPYQVLPPGDARCQDIEPWTPPTDDELPPCVDGRR